MKKILFLFLIIISSLDCFSQTTFEKGYYIINSGQKVECLIKNIDWRNNPVEFEYKLSTNATSKQSSIKSVREFGIYNSSKFIRDSVRIDRSSNDLSEMSGVKNPEFKEEQLFLKVLIEGKANLYSYKDGSLTRYFYKKNDSEIKQLIFKSYRTSTNQIKENNGFRQQIWIHLKCPKDPHKNLENLDYKKRDLTKLFVKYNQCQEAEYTRFENKNERDLFQVSLITGLNFPSLSIKNSAFRKLSAGFGSQIKYRVGLEFEFILPYNNNKWAIIIEPSYQSYSSQRTITYAETSQITRTTDLKINYSSIEVPVGVRYYSYVNEKSKLFLNLAFVFDKPVSTSKKSGRKDLFRFDIETRQNFLLGLGYDLGNGLNFEARYQTNREILSNQGAWTSEYSSLSFIFGVAWF